MLLQEITSEWKREKDATTYKFTVPPNVTASIGLLSNDPARITESGKSIAEAGLRFLWSDGGFAMYQVGSGTYEFVVPK